MKFKITFKDVWEGENEEQVYSLFLDYLHEVVKMEDLTAFDFKVIK